MDFEPFKGGKFVDSELGLIPKGWSTGTIYSYIDVIYGAPYKSALFNDKKQGLPLIRIRDLKTYTPQYYTKEVLPNTEYVECGDIIAGMDAEFIPHIWRGEKGVLNQRLCKFVPKYDYVSKYYIYSLVYPKLAFVQSYKVGTTVSHLGKADIDRFKVIVPPEDIIMQYSKIVNSYFHLFVTPFYPNSCPASSPLRRFPSISLLNYHLSVIFVCISMDCVTLSISIIQTQP